MTVSGGTRIYRIGAWKLPSICSWWYHNNFLRFSPCVTTSNWKSTVLLTGLSAGKALSKILSRQDFDCCITFREHGCVKVDITTSRRINDISSPKSSTLKTWLPTLLNVRQYRHCTTFLFLISSVIRKRQLFHVTCGQCSGSPFIYSQIEVIILGVNHERNSHFSQWTTAKLVYKKSTWYSILCEVYRYSGADLLLLGIFLSCKGVDKTCAMASPTLMSRYACVWRVSP